MNDRQELELRILELEAAQLAGRRRMRRLTGVNALLAVVVLAFGGVGAAYALAPANSVNSASIIDRSIGTPDVKVGAFAGQTILDNSMTAKDIADNSLTGTDINESTLSLTCKPGLTALRGICYSTLHTAGSLYAAYDACVAEGLRLPSISEALRIVTSLSDSSGYWADAIHPVSGTNRGVVVYPNLLVTSELATDLNPFVCVTTVGARP